MVIEKNPNRGISHTRGPQDHVNNVDGRSTSRSRNDSKKDFSSRYYGGPNHYERDCRKKKRDQKNGTTNDKKNDFMIATCDGNIIIVCDDPCDSLTCQQTDWVIDSGASYHITPHREMFESYTGDDFGKVKMANHSMKEVVGIGDRGCNLVLRDVRHVPDIRYCSRIWVANSYRGM